MDGNGKIAGPGPVADEKIDCWFGCFIRVEGKKGSFVALLHELKIGFDSASKTHYNSRDIKRQHTGHIMWTFARLKLATIVRKPSIQFATIILYTEMIAFKLKLITITFNNITI